MVLNIEPKVQETILVTFCRSCYWYKRHGCTIFRCEGVCTNTRVDYYLEQLEKGIEPNIEGILAGGVEIL